MKNFLSYSVLLLALCLSATAQAKSPSFTYVELEYVANGDFEISDSNIGASLDLDGFALNGSLELGVFFVQASRFELETETLFDSKIEDSISTLALGMTFELPRSQVYGLIRGRYDELRVSGGPFDGEEDDGGVVGFEAGARVNLTDRFEINANVGVPSADDGTSYGIGAMFKVSDNLGITAAIRSIDLEEDDIDAKFETTSLGLRLTF